MINLEKLELPVDKKLLSDAKFYGDYSRFNEEKGRFETWEEAVERVMAMHRKKYKHILEGPNGEELEKYIKEAEEGYKKKLALGAQRALQFGGDQLLKHEAKMYNCASSYADRIAFFEEAMYLLLCGCGVGFSAQKHHVKKLPKISKPSNEHEVFEIPDSIEGWARAFRVLLASYMLDDDPELQRYYGKHVTFDYGLIRPRGAYISGGFKAPGHEGLEKSINKCRELLDRACSEGDQLRPIHVYDFVMHMSDAVLSGGIRRSATICIFSIDDEEMLNAKTGEWWIENPQRARSNNSVMIVREEITREQFHKIIQSVKSFGEPGFIFSDSTEFTYNPCVEIGMYPVDIETGKSGFQMCNLSEINGGILRNEDDFYEACRVASILGTLQAGYTNFKVLSEETKKIVEREALLGVSITGWMDNYDLLFNTGVLRNGAKIVKKVNKEVAKLLGINPAARTTCVKPSGNASVLLGTTSGIHAEHAPRYFRHMERKDNDEIVKIIKEAVPRMIEKKVIGDGHDIVIAFPIEASENAKFKKQMTAIEQLEHVKTAQIYWVNQGKNVELCTDPRLSHNVSNTITVDDWDKIEEYIFENRDYFAGISLLSEVGDKAYIQAPFTEVPTPEEVLNKYGTGAMFASGLVVDGIHAFDDLWVACAYTRQKDVVFDDHRAAIKHDWIRRFFKFAKNYFDSDLQKCEECLKDVYLLHKWETIKRQLSQSYPDFSKMTNKEYVDVDTLGAQACSGGVCEIV